MVLYVPMDVVKVGDHQYRIKGKKGSVLTRLGESVEIMGSGSKSPFVITEPGEYEVEGISVFCYRVEEGLGVMIQAEELKCLSLAGIASDALIDDLDIIDVVIVDVDRLESKAAVTMLGKIEPSYVIPSGTAERVGQFVKEFEHTSRETNKLSLSKATMNSDVTDVVILTE